MCSPRRSVYLGSQYVNDFNYLGRTYQVIVQADGQFRHTPQDITRLKARNQFGEMVPIGTVAQMENRTIPYRVPRFNLYPAAEVQGVAAPRHCHRYSTAIAWKNLPIGCCRRVSASNGRTLAYQQQQHGTPTLLVFGAAALFVFLVLVAQYESWKLPLAIVLIVPMCILASVTGLIAPRHAHRYPGADRLRRSRRTGCEECHPDCRIGASGRGRRGPHRLTPRCTLHAHACVLS